MIKDRILFALVAGLVLNFWMAFDSYFQQQYLLAMFCATGVGGFIDGIMHRVFHKRSMEKLDAELAALEAIHNKNMERFQDHMNEMEADNDD